MCDVITKQANSAIATMLEQRHGSSASVFCKGFLLGEERGGHTPVSHHGPVMPCPQSQRAEGRPPLP